MPCYFTLRTPDISSTAICFWFWIILSSAVFLNSGFESIVLFKMFIQKLMHPLDTTENPTWSLSSRSTETATSSFHPRIWAMTTATYKSQVKLSFSHMNCSVWCDQSFLRACKTLWFYSLIPNALTCKVHYNP